MMTVGLYGYGKAGSAVAEVLARDPELSLKWIATRSAGPDFVLAGGSTIARCSTAELDLAAWLDVHPVDALVDFSTAGAIRSYGPQAQQRGLMVVSAVSAYSASDLAFAQQLGRGTRILCSPNMTLGINFLMLAAKLLRQIAPFADVEVLEQHFKEKPEVSGTAKRIAESLDLGEEKITSLRLGGIVGHHEVIFGFPYQTVRLTHESIRREAFGTGAAFALKELAQRAAGFYTFDDLLLLRMRERLLQAA